MIDLSVVRSVYFSFCLLVCGHNNERVGPLHYTPLMNAFRLHDVYSGCFCQ